MAEFRRTRRVKERIGSLLSVSAAFGPAGLIYLGNPGILYYLVDIPDSPNGLVVFQYVRRIYSVCQWFTNPEPEIV